MKEQRRLAAIVSADVAGYAKLMGRDESGTLAALKSLRRDLIDPAIEREGGRIVKTTGDGLLLEFASVVDAVRCVVEVQSAIAARNAEVPEDRRIEFRVGVNLGDIIIDGEDIFGDGVNVAARLQAIAEPGGVTVSSHVFDDVRDRLDARFADAGEQVLKNIARPVRVYRWLRPGENIAAAREPVPVKKTPLWLGRLAAGVLSLALGAVVLWWLPELAAIVDPRQPKTMTRPVPVSSRPSIAVLPFVNQSGNPAQDYFSDGITEDVISALGRFPSLTVMSRNAVFPFKGKNAKPAEIGRELDVRYIVEGSVRRAGERIRVSAQLTEAMTGTLLWSQQYDEAMKDVFAVQDLVTRQVAGALEAGLTRIEQQRVLAKPTESLDAYDLVLRGRERLARSTRAANCEAREFFDQAVRLDPNYAAAYAWNGRAHLDLASFGWTEDPVEAADRAMELGKKALALDADSLEGLAVVGSAHTLRSEYDLALAASDRMLAINPNDAANLLGRAGILLWLGRIDEAITTNEMAFRFDPNPRAPSVFAYGLALYQARRHEDAVRVLERGALRFPDAPFIYFTLAASYAQLGRMQEAAQAMQAFRRLNPFFDVATLGSRFQNKAHQAYLLEGIAKIGVK